MRLLSLVLLGFALIVGPAGAAEKGGGGRHQARAAVAKPQAAARPQAGRPRAAVHRSAPLRGQGSVGRDQRAASAASCSAKPDACRAPRMSWAQGLAPAAGIQANACPDGTMAVLATGHDDIVRCMPI